ncbi:hypothetical protein B0T24DRAFT_420103 [Lasiosphaeria ovina]|uniref:Uncharacterized protein n=1 Tax=Lasiosphaeria ovina TaxID=92902 RepID=A0AAE0MZ90_9PEZI|nr:hypothetical protein B0T24DRAFT_420103 [Lasiosphaeria ovina]
MQQQQQLRRSATLAQRWRSDSHSDSNGFAPPRVSRSQIPPSPPWRPSAGPRLPRPVRRRRPRADDHHRPRPKPAKAEGERHEERDTTSPVLATALAMDVLAGHRGLAPAPAPAGHKAQPGTDVLEEGLPALPLPHVTPACSSPRGRTVSCSKRGSSWLQTRPLRRQGPDFLDQFADVVLELTTTSSPTSSSS